MTKELSLDFGLDEPTDDAHVRSRVARALGSSLEALPPVTLRKKSGDARRRSVRVHPLFESGPADEPKELGAPHPREVGAPRVAIVGDGPAGLFCAYQLARA